MTASSYEHIINFHVPYLLQFRKEGWVTHVVADYMPPDVPFADKSISMPFKKHANLLNNIQTVLSIRKLIKTEQYDLIITHTTLGAFLTRLAIVFRINRPKLIYMCHGYLFSPDMPWQKNALLKTAEFITAPVTDLLLEMNEYDINFARHHRLANKTGFVPGIGIDFEKLDSSVQEDRICLRNEYDLSEQDIVLIFAAEFSGRKAQSILISAMTYLPDNYVLALPGTGKLFEECVLLAQSTGKRIIFPGYVEDTSPWYRMADIAVTSARTEGLPFNVMEAMHMGLPVVASAVKGHVDLIREGETGFLYPFGDTLRCAEQILKVSADEALKNRIIHNAQVEVEQYSLSKVFPVVMNLYKSLGIRKNNDEKNKEHAK